MEEASPPPDSRRRPSFSTFWKRTKEASESETRQVTFVPIDIPRITKGRSSKSQSKSSSPADAHDVSRSSDSTHLGGRGSDQEEEDGMEGQTGGEAVHSSEGSASPAAAGASNQTAKEKAQVRRAQVRRAQIQHRKRKADYMRQLELDIDMLRDLITNTEQDMKTMKNDNDAIRAQLGVAAVARTDTAPSTNPSTNSPSSIFDGFDLNLDLNLDDINVSIVMDETIGNPICQISSTTTPDASLATVPYDANAALTQGTPVSSFEAGFVPTFETDLANSTQPPAGYQAPPSYMISYLPELSVAETHSIVNLILALEHVCWGHACKKWRAPDAEIGTDEGHSLMASSFFLRDAPGGFFSKIETTTNGIRAFKTNTTLEDAAATKKHLGSHQALDGLQWQAPDVSLQTLHGLAVSLNPRSDKELAPVQAWFELASRYPLYLLLRTDVIEALKRELVGVVRCYYFGAVMERDAFESVVQRVVESALQAIDVPQAVPQMVFVPPQ